MFRSTTTERVSFDFLSRLLRCFNSPFIFFLSGFPQHTKIGNIRFFYLKLYKFSLIFTFTCKRPFYKLYHRLLSITSFFSHLYSFLITFFIYLPIRLLNNKSLTLFLLALTRNYFWYLISIMKPMKTYQNLRKKEPPFEKE